MIIRIAPGSYGADGRFNEGPGTNMTIVASVQPSDGRDLLRLPEGLRTHEVLRVYSATEMKVQGAGQDPDWIIIDGFRYQCQTAEQWGRDGNFWKMLVSKIGRAAP